MCMISVLLWCSVQLFNKRTGSLVLGAEARRSTGLKTITAKHLGKC